MKMQSARIELQNLTINIVITQDWREGAQTSIHLAVSNEGSRVTGEYFADCKVR